MEKMQLYSVYDSSAGACGPLFEAPNDKVAYRNFVNLLRDIPKEFHHDYQLLAVGEVERDGQSVILSNTSRKVSYLEVKPNE